MYRKYYSYNDMPVIKKPPLEKPVEIKKEPPKKASGNFPGGLESDDILLIVVFVILIMDNCEDRLLLLALAFIFFSDYFTD